MLAGASFDPGSFRDRNGRVFEHDGRIYRALGEDALAAWETLDSSSFFHRFVDAGRIVATGRVDRAAEPPLADRDRWAAVLRHERVPFVTYPYEWPFRMLRDAALLELDLMDAALAEDMILKDASPFNVQWIGTEPVFIDVASFERLAPGAVWVGYRQFCELFLYPLLLQAHRGVPFQPWLRGSLDGIPAADASRLFSLRDWLRPGVLAHVVLQARAQARFAGRPGDVRGALARAGFPKALIVANVRRLRRVVAGLAWRPAPTAWSDYAASSPYGAEDRAAKTRFVAEVAGARRRRLVWDLGANTGEFARRAAPDAACVVALDGDAVAVERMYAALKADGQRTIVPLVMDLTNPSPGVGWRGRERATLAERGRPDLVFCLALLHHLVLAGNVPLPAVVEWLADLGGELVVEFVGRDDPMVQGLLRNKTERYDDYDAGVLERRLAERGTIVRRVVLPGGTRTLYHVRPDA
jgi:SAM-dependent methyltransferase